MEYTSNTRETPANPLESTKPKPQGRGHQKIRISNFAKACVMLGTRSLKTSGLLMEGSLPPLQAYDSMRVGVCGSGQGTSNGHRAPRCRARGQRVPGRAGPTLVGMLAVSVHRQPVERAPHVARYRAQIHPDRGRKTQHPDGSTPS